MKQITKLNNASPINNMRVEKQNTLLLPIRQILTNFPKSFSTDSLTNRTH